MPRPKVEAAAGPRWRDSCSEEDRARAGASIKAALADEAEPPDKDLENHYTAAARCRVWP